MSSQIMPSDPDTQPNRSEDTAALEEDARLRDDIRLLGRILGDTVRDQEGADVFDLVERIRQTSIRFHRDDDRPARRELEIILDGMSTARPCGSSAPSAIFRISPTSPRTRTISGRCARRQRRRAAGQARSALTLSHAREAGFSAADLRKFFGSALVSPVLTAHPTEVRRKSTIDREMEIAALLDRRERVQLTPEEIEASDEQLRRAVLTLWQTNLLRRTKLTVLDEVANGLVVLRLHLPARGAAAALRARGPAERGGCRRARRAGVVPADGKLDRRRSRRQSLRHRRCDARHAAPAERAACCGSISRSCTRWAPNCRLPRISPTFPTNCAHWRERSPDTSPHRSGEPYRLAVSGIYARLAATALRLKVETNRPPVGEAAPYGSAREFKADLDILDRSLIANNSGVIARGRLRLLRRAVDCFGFHLASLDMRQNSAVHERTVAELIGRRDARHVLSGAERRRADRAAHRRTAQRAAADLGLREIQRRDAGRTRDLP